jgi:hypothetical protein
VSHALDFDPAHRVLRLTLTGALTEAGFLVAREDVAHFIQIEGPCHGLFDYRGISKFDISADFVRRLAEQPPTFPVDAIRVVVASQCVIYGMIRMFQIIGSDTRQGLYVVKTMEDAYALLGFQSLDFSRRVCDRRSSEETKRLESAM